jgi:hypothetical protein
LSFFLAFAFETDILQLSAVFQAGGLVVALVEVTRKSYLASIVPVVVNAVLNEHQVVLDIIAFVPLGDFPRSRLGEKQRGKILASWVTRKMRTIAQFSIRDPDGSEPQLADVPEARGATPKAMGARGGSVRKPTPQMESDYQGAPRPLAPSHADEKALQSVDPYAAPPGGENEMETLPVYQDLRNEPDQGIPAVSPQAGSFLLDDTTPVEAPSRLAIRNPEAQVYEMATSWPTSADQNVRLDHGHHVQTDYHELDENPSPSGGQGSVPPSEVDPIPDFSGGLQSTAPLAPRGRDSLPSQQLRYSGIMSGNPWESRYGTSPPGYRAGNQPKGHDGADWVEDETSSQSQY